MKPNDDFDLLEIPVLLIVSAAFLFTLGFVAQGCVKMALRAVGQ